VFVIEVGDVALSAPNPDRLWGRNIEVPQPDSQIDGHLVDLIGWVLGKSSPAVAVEVVHEGQVVRRVPITIHRPDIEVAFPNVPGAQNSGFRIAVSVTGMSHIEVSVQAVLKDHSRVALGTVRARRSWREGDYEVGAALVSVVIPCHNQAHFLQEAIESVLSQTYPHFEIVVVDDGSTDNTQEVASRYPGVRCVRQEKNQGLAEARNMGIRHTNGSYLVFLDADDRLLPEALEGGLRALKDHPECAFVAGRYRYIAFDGSPLPTPQPPRVEGDHYLALLKHNYIAAPATVMYRRPVFEYVNGFDSSVSPAEDYDLYLRVAREFPIHRHETVIPEIRQNETIANDNSELTLISTLAVLHSQQRRMKDDNRHGESYKTGARVGRSFYGEQLAKEVRALAQKREWKRTTQGMIALLRFYPRGLASALRSKPM
jgi:glycosyltransferase involved in cell wall biosynthesis